MTPRSELDWVPRGPGLVHTRLDSCQAETALLTTLAVGRIGAGWPRSGASSRVSARPLGMTDRARRPMPAGRSRSSSAKLGRCLRMSHSSRHWRPSRPRGPIAAALSSEPPESSIAAPVWCSTMWVVVRRASRSRDGSPPGRRSRPAKARALEGRPSCRPTRRAAVRRLQHARPASARSPRPDWLALPGEGASVVRS